jgi:hypothetical protein
LQTGADMTSLHRSRFAGLSRAKVGLIVIGVLLAIVASLPSRAPLASAPAITAPIADSTKRDEDLALYGNITQRIAGGEHYYPVTADALRRDGYPLRPFITFRLPMLAVLSAKAGPVITRIALWLLMIATLIAWYRRLNGAFDDKGRRITAVMLIASGMTIAARPEYIVVHEVWAGLLLALSLGLHRPDRWGPSVIAALAAVLIRELALPFLLLMWAFALVERRLREAVTWALAITVFALVLWLHAGQVALVTTAADPASPGWITIGGWPAFMRAMVETSALRVLPGWAAAALVIAALFGWISWRSRTGLFGTLMFAGYAVIFVVLGRPENFYWGLIVSPLLLLGLAFLPRAFADLRAAR